MALSRTTWLLAVAVAMALLWVVPSVTAQGAAAPSPAADAPESGSGAPGTWEILKAGGTVGIVIMLLSVAAVALVIEHVMTIRGSVLMPPSLAEEVRGLLSEGKLGPAVQRCRREPSFLAFVLEAGLTEADGGWPAVEKATEDATADQSARLFRKIEYLSVIGNIAPMLGLLGTVIGMIIAFQQVAGTGGAVQAADLATGIYKALVTTVEGLIVAIPSLAAFAVFRNRVDQLVAETVYVTQHVFTPLKRARPSSSPRSPAAPPPPPAGGA